jgi:hypothetical protein
LLTLVLIGIQSVFIDSGRAEVFEKVKIQTALAVPVFSGKSVTPAFVLCCYSFVRTGSVPFVLKFVQQALRLLWEGLDQVEPHESVGKELWRDVAPADLGEMAADVEMQQHFLIKKRPHNAMSSVMDETDPELTTQLDAMDVRSGIPSTRSIYTGIQDTSPPMGPVEEVNSPDLQPTLPRIQVQMYQTVQNHLQDAIRSVGDASLFPSQMHVATNMEGTKRAFVFEPSALSDPQQSQPAPHAPPQHHNFVNSHHIPLPMPGPLAMPNQILMHSPVDSYQNPPNQTQANQVQAHQHNPMPFAQPSNPQQYDRYYAPISTAPSPMHSPHMQSYIAPVPTNQISATGISFPQPQNIQSSVMNGLSTMNGSAPVAPNPVVMSSSAPFCLAANGSDPVGVEISGRVSNTIVGADCCVWFFF